MFGNRALAMLFLALPITACAQPKYYTLNPTGDGQSKPAADILADCSLKFAKSGLCFSWKWNKKPVNDEPASLILKTYRPNVHDGTVIPVDTQPAVVLWMPAMGHGSAPTKINRLDVGTYQVDNVIFLMPGKWQLKFQLKEGAAVQDETIVDVTIQ